MGLSSKTKTLNPFVMKKEFHKTSPHPILLNKMGLLREETGH